MVYYNCGPYFNFQYVYPYYHRKHIFVSFGGWWPQYTCLRYYWYPYHSYFWYGYYPPVYRVDGDTYNYYTYNYYGGDDGSAQGTYGLTPVDANTFADVREKLAAQKAQTPANETDADQYFEEGVQAFEKGDYAAAADKFAEAISLESNDVVLPFAYCQALFASGRYSEAAAVLREAVAKLPPDEEGVIFPRGLYPNDDILQEQIGILADKAELDFDNEDLQLLLGYQLLGAEKFDQAVEPLQRIDPYGENSKTAAALVALLEKIRTQTAEQTSGQ
jgi:tetratricopeptide (TPR) repeat protein